MTLRLGVTLAVLCLGISGAYAEEGTVATLYERYCLPKDPRKATIKTDITVLGPGATPSNLTVCNCSKTKGIAHLLTPQGLPVNKDAPISIEPEFCLPFNGVNGLQLLRSGAPAEWEAVVIYR